MAGNEERTCAYCLNEGSVMVDPRSLPCRHMFCFTCLEDALPTQTITGVFKCPVCRVDHSLAGHADLAHLPTAVISTEVMEQPPSEKSFHSGVKLPPESCCDGCMHKDLRRAALMFCVQCNIKMCTAHNESHDHLWGIGKHLMITVDDFQQQRDKFAARFCSAHNKQSLDFICVKCQQLLCVTCWSDAAADCLNGEVHDVKPLEGIVRQIKEKLREAMEPLLQLQRKLDKALIQSDECSNMANSKCDDLIIQLHKARDLQLQAITAAYGRLEEKIDQIREAMLNQYKTYGEKLQVEIVRLQAACKEADEMLANKNNVDVVLQAEDPHQPLIYECKCDLMLPIINCVELIPIRQSRLPEVDLLVLPSQPDNKPTADIPAVNLVKKLVKKNKGVDRNWYYSVSHTDQGNLVASGVRGFDYRHASGTISRSVELPGTVDSCCVSKHSLYISHYDGENTWIRKYSNEGQLRFCWSASHVGSLSVVGERIFTVNRMTKQVVVYSMHGDLLYNFSHPSFIEPYRVIAADPKSIILCDARAHLVSKLSVWDNTVVWQYSGLKKPWAAAVDKQGRIWVAADREIHVLSVEGQFLVRLDIPQADDVCDISIHEDQLAVADHNRLLLYEIHLNKNV